MSTLVTNWGEGRRGRTGHLMVITRTHANDRRENMNYVTEQRKRRNGCIQQAGTLARFARGGRRSGAVNCGNFAVRG